MSADALILFLKRPAPGEVKTRLVPDLGPAAAAELYRVLAEAEVRGTAPRSGEYRRLFFYAPPEAGPEMESWFPGETWVAQSGADLGQRMSDAFEEAFRRGARRAAIIGSDVPWVSRETVAEALRGLERQDVVVGPAEDGGYYLLALDRPRPELFRGVRWSTASVLEATLERAAAQGLGVGLLDRLPDVDTIEDVRRAWDRLRPLVAGRPLEQVLEAAVRRAGPSRGP
jgi:uncharacterized protein